MQATKDEIKSYILAQVRQSSDFPAMSGTISLINKFKSAEANSVSEFANVVLKDYALTSKILKVVNSVGYAQFGEVTTISRAIILLGFENVRNLALTLMLFEHLQKKGSNLSLIDTIVKSFYSAILAQKIAYETSFVDKEEAFICSLLHAFGKIMVAFYMPEKLEEINAYCREQNEPEGIGVLAVLSMTYEEIGMEIAREWKLPAKIVSSMRNMRSSDIGPSPNDTERLSSISTFSNSVSAILSSGDKKEQDAKIAQLMKVYKDHFGKVQGTISGLIKTSMQDLTDFSNILKINLKTVPFSRELFGWASGKQEEGTKFTFTSDSLMTIDNIIEDEKKDTPEVIFTKGIQDVNNSIVGNFSLNDIVRIVLETMYRGMQLSGTSRVLFLIKDTKLPVMTVRFGFGNGIDELKNWFKVSLDESVDLFNMAIMKRNDFVIKDVDAPDIVAMLPAWYRDRVPSSVFVVILPIIVSSKPLGMFYIEGEKRSIQNITGGLLNYLKIMRDQTVLAIKQKQGY